MMQKKAAFITIAFLGVLVPAVLLRCPTFTLPHDNGDQLIYTALAMKLDRSGLSGYNLRGIGLKAEDSFFDLTPASGRGELLENLIQAGCGYYDETLFHRPYGLPFALMLSHRISAPGEPYALLRTSARDDQGRIYVKDPQRWWPVQFYAVLIPFLFSLLFILATYFFTRRFFSEKMALIAAFLISISPIEILAAQKIWADTMLSFFVLLSVWLYLLAREKDSLAVSFLGGISCGLSVVVKQSGGFILIVLFLSHLWQNRKELRRPRHWLRILCDKHILIFAAGLFLASGHWFYIISKTYGDPLYNPARAYPQLKQQALWFRVLEQRPRYLLLVSTVYLVPVFALAYLTVLAGPFWRGFIDSKKSLLVIWLLTFLGIFLLWGSRENRYLLPAYPALAILSAALLERIGIFIGQKSKPAYGGALVIFILIACAIWSAPIGIKHAFGNMPLILQPF